MRQHPESKDPASNVGERFPSPIILIDRIAARDVSVSARVSTFEITPTLTLPRRTGRGDQSGTRR